MKCPNCNPVVDKSVSLPSRGAWIEIISTAALLTKIMSLPSRGAWIEIIRIPHAAVEDMSLPSRGAWIEIKATNSKGLAVGVAPLAGSVD